MSRAMNTRRITAAASFGFALVRLDFTMINVALPRLADALHCDVAGLQWLVDAYTLAFAALLLSAGVFTDRFGAARVYAFGLWAFAGTSIACALASSSLGLIAARACQGAAAAAMLPSSLALVNHATAHDGALQARAIGVWTAAGSITIAAGPIVGGLLLQIGDWPGLFWINVPVCALGGWLLHSARAEFGSSRRREADLPGQLLALLALGGLIAGLIELRPLGARHPFVVGSLTTALLSGVALVLVERRSREPLLPLPVFRTANFVPALWYGVTVNLTYYGLVFVLSLFLQRVHGYSPLQTGLAYLPLTASFFGVNLFSGWLVGRIGPRWPMTCGALIDAAGFALLLQLDASSPYLLMLPAFALIPLGMGLGVPAMTVSVLRSVDRHWAGTASAVLNAGRQAAGAIGVAAFGALAGGDSARVVGGLHASAALAVGMLLVAAGVAFRWVGGAWSLASPFTSTTTTTTTTTTSS
jgi:MFS transporter, DHA2 family, methylenomycin A resistance protein